MRGHSVGVGCGFAAFAVAALCAAVVCGSKTAAGPEASGVAEGSGGGSAVRGSACSLAAASDEGGACSLAAAVAVAVGADTTTLEVSGMGATAAGGAAPGAAT